MHIVRIFCTAKTLPLAIRRRLRSVRAARLRTHYAYRARCLLVEHDEASFLHVRFDQRPRWIYQLELPWREQRAVATGLKSWTRDKKQTLNDDISKCVVAKCSGRTLLHVRGYKLILYTSHRDSRKLLPLEAYLGHSKTVRQKRLTRLER